MSAPTLSLGLDFALAIQQGAELNAARASLLRLLKNKPEKVAFNALEYEPNEITDRLWQILSGGGSPVNRPRPVVFAGKTMRMLLTGYANHGLLGLSYADYREAAFLFYDAVKRSKELVYHQDTDQYREVLRPRKKAQKFRVYTVTTPARGGVSGQNITVTDISEQMNRVMASDMDRQAAAARVLFERQEAMKAAGIPFDFTEQLKLMVEAMTKKQAFR